MINIWTGLLMAAFVGILVFAAFWSGFYFGRSKEQETQMKDPYEETLFDKLTGFMADQLEQFRPRKNTGSNNNDENIRSFFE